MQLLRVPVPDMVVPSTRMTNRILLLHGLAQPRPRRRSALSGGLIGSSS
jgi:hypothetical protein